MSSSMRNAVQRRNHRERAQPLERQKWGLLEKNKDYKLRAKDHKEKQKRLKLLRQKAVDRNPDEFSFGMLSSGVNKATGTKRGDRGNEALSNDVVKLLKTQDAGYIRTMLQKVRKEREKAEEGFVLDDEEGEIEALKGRAGKGKHTVFVGDKQEQSSFQPEEWFGVEDEERLMKPWSRQIKKSKNKDDDDEMADGQPSKKTTPKDDASAAKEERRIRKMREQAQEHKRLKIEALKNRERELMLAEQEIEKQRANMSNTAGGVNKNGIKFKVRERKR
ncbi:U3 snoRNP-associated protein-like protein Utp11 [Phyllosticta citrichinensis]|uniref:U3 small nucleolar RNA-associated protein 11 n=1 Tax=Phyllosticta citrichinensis TaxID=1130410 RepID=A0ABR1XQX5_9PEZI